MEINLFTERNTKGKVSVIIYKNGFRASMRLEYKDGTKERIQRFSAKSPEEAKQKLYKCANKKYYENLSRYDNEIVFSPTTNKELLRLEKDVPEKVVNGTKDELLFKNIAKEWLDMCLKKTNKEETNRTINNNTFEYYRTMTNSYLVEDFGDVRITEITEEIVQEKFDKRVTLSYKTLKGLKSILLQILKFAKKKKYIKGTIELDIVLPEYKKPEIDFYNEVEINTFKEICEKDKRRMALLYRYILVLGLRPEEGCGLKWHSFVPSKSDDELAKMVIDNAIKDFKIYNNNHEIIRHEKRDDTLKTPESYRTLPLEKDDEKLLLEFKKKEQKRLGKNFSEDGYIFLNMRNGPYLPEILTNKMPFFLEKWDLPHITPYGLRHSKATLWAKKGIKTDILKIMMGHSDIATTYKYYIHLTEQDVMEEVMLKMRSPEELIKDEIDLNKMQITMVELFVNQLLSHLNLKYDFVQVANK